MAIKKAPKKTTRKPAVRNVKQSPAQDPASKAEPKPMAILSFTCRTADGGSVSWTQFVDATITQDEIAAIAAKKAKGGEILKAQLIPYAPKD
jgi:hypothetical protein